MRPYNLDEKTSIMSMFSVKSPDKILREGDSADFKHFNLPKYVPVEISEVKNDNIVIFAKEQIPDVIMDVEDHVVLNCTALDDLYVMSGRILKIEALKPLVAKLNITKIEKMKDLRKNERYSVSLPVIINNNIFAVVKNISLGGIKINCKDEFSLNSIVSVEVKFDRTTKCAFTGTIVRKNVLIGCFEYGIEINSMSESNSKNLHRFIYDFDNL